MFIRFAEPVRGQVAVWSIAVITCLSGVSPDEIRTPQPDGPHTGVDPSRDLRGSTAAFFGFDSPLSESRPRLQYWLRGLK